MSEHLSLKNTDAAAARDSEPFLVLAETRPVRRRFRRRWILASVLLGLLACGALAVQLGLLPGKRSTTAAVARLANDTVQAVQSGNSTEQTEMAENVAGLALQGISLFNGEKGAELWRLKASWAHLTKEGDTILVDAPVVRYTLGEPADNDYLDVKSEKGTITDSQRYLTLTGNVDVRHVGDTVTGPRLHYDSKTRVMVFPDGATLESERATGKADVFTWDLTNSTMQGEGNVDVLIKPQASAPDPAAISDTAPAVTSSVVPAPAPAAIQPKVTTRTPQAAPTKKGTAPKKTVTKTPSKPPVTKKASPRPTPAQKPAPHKSTPKKSATPAKSAS